MLFLVIEIYEDYGREFLFYTHISEMVAFWILMFLYM